MTELTEAFVQIADAMKVAFEAADGLKADLASRGYSETAQEQIAVLFIVGSLQQMGLAPKG